MDGDYASLYAAMADEELQSLAAEADDLTDEARSALWGELRQRGLEPQAKPEEGLREHRAAETQPPEKFATVAVFNDFLNANLAKSKLESEGVFCFLADEHVARMNWLYSLFVGRIKLQVRESDAARAADLLWEDKQTRDFLD